MKVKVDYGRCIKSGECYYNHPDLFEGGEDGFPVIRRPQLSNEQEKTEAEQAAEVCPSEAISVEGKVA